MGSSCFPDYDEFEDEMNPDEEMNHNEEQDIENSGQEAAETPEVTRTPESGSKRKDVPESSTANGKLTTELRVINPRSLVWDHFTRTTEDRNKCFCHYCKKLYGCKSKSGTSNLTKHLAACKEYQAYKENKQVIKGNGKLQVAKISEPMFREATNEMLVLGELPLSFVDSVAWRHFSSRANLYRPHSRRTASRDIVQMYVKKKALLKNWINSNKQRVSLITDIWTAPTTGASYMVITAHFIDAFWMLKKLIIGFKYVSDHKASAIASTLLDCLADWEIKKVFSVTMDNATANTLAMKKFQREFGLVSNEAFVLDGDNMHVRCSAHIMNLIVRDGLQELSKNVEAIRNGVAYVRSSHARQRSFELRVDSGKL